MSKPVISSEVGIEQLADLRFRRASRAWRTATAPELNQVSSTSGSCSSCAEPQLRAVGRRFARHDDLAAIAAMPRRNAMPPPQLARDAPVADVVHPFVIGLRPVFGDELDARRLHRRDGLFGQRLGVHEPLRGDQRLHDSLAAIALADGQRVRLDLFQQAQLLQIRHDAVARFEAVEAGVGTALRPSCAPFSSITLMRGRSWRLPASKSLGSCAGVTFTAPEPNSGSARSSRMMGISRFISGSVDGAAVQVDIARVLGVHRHGGIAEHGFRPRGGDDHDARPRAR